MSKRVKILLALFLMNATVESLIPSHQIPRRPSTGSSTFSRSFVSNVQVKDTASNPESSEVKVQSRYPIFSRSRNMTLKTNWKQFLDKSFRMFIFSVFIFKGILTQPVHAISPSPVVSKSQTKSLPTPAPEVRNSRVLIKKRVIGITFGLTTVLGILAIRKTEDSKILSLDKTDPFISKAKELIAKADQLEESLNREQSTLSEILEQEGLDVTPVEKDMDKSDVIQIGVSFPDIEEDVTTEMTADIDDMNPVIVNESSSVVHLGERIGNEPYDVALMSVIKEEEEICLPANDDSVVKDVVMIESMEEHLELVEIDDIPAVDAEQLESIDAEENVDAATIKTKLEETSYQNLIEAIEEIDELGKVSNLDSNVVPSNVEDEEITITEEATNLDNNAIPSDVKEIQNVFDYSAIEDPSERAFRLLVNLGMVKENLDPKSANYDHSDDDEFAVENIIISS